MIDVAEIVAQGGDGGNGVVSFRREKFVPKGGPDGGDGGRGGSVYLVGSASLRTLKGLRRNQVVAASRGANGRGKDQQGKSGQHAGVEVPIGTVVFQKDSGEVVGDAIADGYRIEVARGGRGGRGNARFATSTQRVPYVAEQGQRGEEVRLRLELRMLADVGIVGKPNAGKSTLLGAVTGSTTKIGSYPFTTKEPALGAVAVGWKSFVMAEIPGLIEGAHLGLGLGHEFLRHATRTKVLLHVVDGGEQDVAGALREVEDELREYGSGLSSRPRVIVVNKIDMPEVGERQGEIKRQLQGWDLPIFFASAAARVGLDPVINTVAAMVAEREQQEIPVPEPVAAVSDVAHAGMDRVTKSNGAYLVLDDQAVRLVGGSDIGKWAGRAQLKLQLDRLGVTRALEDAGIDFGDTVRFGDIEIEW